MTNQDQNQEKIVDQGKNNPVDYALAGLGGLLGGPVGVVLSVATVHFMSEVSGAKQKWIIWFLVGVFAAPLSCMGTIAFMDAANEDQTPSQEQIQPE
jgi:hypothetical protein